MSIKLFNSYYSDKLVPVKKPNPRDYSYQFPHTTDSAHYISFVITSSFCVHFNFNTKTKKNSFDQDNIASDSLSESEMILQK